MGLLEEEAVMILRNHNIANDGSQSSRYQYHKNLLQGAMLEVRVRWAVLRVIVRFFLSASLKHDVVFSDDLQTVEVEI